MKGNTQAVVKIKESVDANTPALKGIIEDVKKKRENAALHKACKMQAEVNVNKILREAIEHSDIFFVRESFFPTRNALY